MVLLISLVVIGGSQAASLPYRCKDKQSDYQGFKIQNKILKNT